MKCSAAFTLLLATMALAMPRPHEGDEGAPPAAGNTSAPATPPAKPSDAVILAAAPAANGTAPGAGGAGGGDKGKEVSAAIDSWLKDIKGVNKFVDSAATLKTDAEITAAATEALKFAENEGKQNDALAKLVKLDEAGTTANKALAAQFGIIGPAIKDTVANPKNLQKNVEAINKARCGGAIAQEGAVQQSAAKAAGVKAAEPELPKACGKEKASAPATPPATGTTPANPATTPAAPPKKPAMKRWEVLE